MLHKILFFRNALVLVVLSILLGNVVFPTPVHADSLITVTTSSDNTISDTFCSLREAIVNSNNDAGIFSDCAPGSGNDVITFDDALDTSTITLISSLPIIDDTDGLIINGGGDIAISGNDNYQIIKINSNVPLTLDSIIITQGNMNIFGNTYPGGGVSNKDGILTIINSTFSYNSTISGGGGVYNSSSGSLIIVNSTFSNNTAGGGGGGVNNRGQISIANSTFFSNHANDGGGVFDSGFPNYLYYRTITNTTFSDNTAVYGGGIWIDGGIWLYNTIIANNAASIGSDCYLSNLNSGVVGNNNLIEETGTNACNMTNGIDGNIVGSDPTLGLLTGSPSYFPLNTGSLAINTGDDAKCAAEPVSNTSQNGLIRPQGEHCDIGAYESPVVEVPTPQEKILELNSRIYHLIDLQMISSGNGNSLISKLDNAVQALNSGNTSSAGNKLNSFINEVNALVNSGKLTPSEGQSLIDAAQGIIDSL